MVLLAVQDGMTEPDIAPFVGPSVGVFLGGSTPWKISHMERWGTFCRSRAVYYHVARVNTARRVHQATAAGCDSMDGSSGTRFAVTIPFLQAAMEDAARLKAMMPETVQTEE
jgi:hypothetical protein